MTPLFNFALIESGFSNMQLKISSTSTHVNMMEVCTQYHPLRLGWFYIIFWILNPYQISCNGYTVPSSDSQDILMTLPFFHPSFWANCFSFICKVRICIRLSSLWKTDHVIWIIPWMPPTIRFSNWCPTLYMNLKQRFGVIFYIG